jgi:cbb3-type cytochrome c oxidase subunit II
VGALRNYWWVRLISAVQIVVGFVCFCFGILTGPRNQEEEPVEGAPSIVQDVDVRIGRWLETANVITFAAGMGFLLLSFVVLGVMPGFALAREIRKTAPSSMPELTASEVRGRVIYGREGCAYCHTQQVRFVASDHARWGHPTEAWETRYEYPQLWGTRRIGPDLARESAVHSDDWQLMHLYDPRTVIADSNMPGFPWLFSGSATHPNQDALDVLEYVQSLGRPRQLAGYDSASAHPPAPILQGGSPKRGSQLFGENCASCHGASGDGNGAGAAGLFPRPTNLTVIEYLPAHLSHILWNGVPGSAMPRWNRLSHADLQDIASYVRSIQTANRRDISDASLIEQGRILYRRECTGCHGMDGDGNGPAAGALAPGPANFHEEHPAREYALDVLQNGIPGTAMPPWQRQMTDAERQAVVAYLESLYQSPVH